MHDRSNEETERWIEDYVESETAGARKRVEDSEAVVQKEQEDMKHSEITGLTNREPAKSVDQMTVAIEDSLGDLASSNFGDDGEYEDAEETEQSKLSEDDEFCWVRGTISQSEQQPMERFRNKQMKLD